MPIKHNHYYSICYHILIAVSIEEICYDVKKPDMN